jgi:undecaprenyl-diphosphatase
MALWFAVILGLAQGAAEFLPISSSGHLALLQAFFPALAPEESLTFDVLLHLGTLVSLAAVYRRKLWELVRALLPGSGEKGREGRRLLGLLALGTLPLGLVLPLRGWIEARCADPRFIGAALLVNGVLLYISDKLVAGRKKLPSPGGALLAGFLQAFAALPGISRSGSTVTAGVLAGLRREDAVGYSFLLSFPAVLGACLVKLPEAVHSGFDQVLLLPALAGAAAAALSGLLAIRLVGRLAKKGSFRKFSLYCWALGLAAIILSFLT